MSDLLTPAELAEIAAKRDGMMHDVLPCHGSCKLCVVNALLRHIAALEARTPAPADDPDMDGTDFAHPAWWRGHHQTTEMFCHHVQAILDGRDVKDESVSPEPWHTVRKRLLALVEKSAPAHCQCAECKPWLDAEKPAPATDVDALLARGGYKAVLAALRQEAVDKCGGGFGAPDLNADYQLSLSLLVREVYQILNIEQHIDALATALRESRAREVAAEKKYQRLFEPWDEVNGWCEHNHQFSYRLDDEDNSDGCMQCERDAAIARAEKAEAERDRLAQYHGGHRPTCSGMDELESRCDCGYLQGEVYRELIADLAAARAELGALGKKAAEAVEVAYKSGITDTSSMPGPKIIEQMWQDSTARRAALAIRVVKEAQ